MQNRLYYPAAESERVLFRTQERTLRAKTVYFIIFLLFFVVGVMLLYAISIHGWYIWLVLGGPFCLVMSVGAFASISECSEIRLGIETHDLIYVGWAFPFGQTLRRYPRNQISGVQLREIIGENSGMRSLHLYILDGTEKGKLLEGAPKDKEAFGRNVAELIGVPFSDGRVNG